MASSYSPSPRSKKRVSLYDISPEFFLPEPQQQNLSNYENLYATDRQNSESQLSNQRKTSIDSITTKDTAAGVITDLTNHKGRNRPRTPSPTRGRTFRFPPPPSSTSVSGSLYKSTCYNVSKESLEQTIIDENSTSVTQSRAPSPVRFSGRANGYGNGQVHADKNGTIDSVPNLSIEPAEDNDELEVLEKSEENPELLTPEDNDSLKPISSSKSPPRSSSPVNIKRKPFNFQSVVASRSPVNKPNQRRGHKYKHSSVSMNFFMEPPPRPPPVLPTHFPIPNYDEIMHSMSRDQKIQLGWCATHFLIGMYMWLISYNSTVLMALSHILFYDGFAAALSVLVDVLSNFEVWKSSSIRHPFGLQRMEILAGFASTVGLLFMGIDIGSHLCENFVKNVIAESQPHDHESERFFVTGTNMALTLGLFATIVSSIVFRNHERVGTAVQFTYIRKLPYGLNNPLFLTTIACSLFMISLPLLTTEPYFGAIDNFVAVLVALSMCFSGWMTALTLGRMLLMGFNSKSTQLILKRIRDDPDIKSIEESRIWQVHYSLCIINLRIKLHGSSVDETRVRANINRIIADVLKADMGAKCESNAYSSFTPSFSSNGTQANTIKYSERVGLQWESTIDIDNS
ncbi:cation efflux family-domain-containing protein [Dipodascopsis uninucleata]